MCMKGKFSMAVLKNQIPILEFDTEQSAVIMPGHHSDYNFPQKAVMLWSLK